MDEFTITDLDEELMQRLASRAARRGRSIEDEALEVIREALDEGSAVAVPATTPSQE